MKRDTFEDELFDSLSDYNSHLDKEEAWQSLEKKLPKKEEKKRPISPFWLNMFGLVLLAGIVLYSFNVDKSNVEFDQKKFSDGQIAINSSTQNNTLKSSNKSLLQRTDTHSKEIQSTSDVLSINKTHENNSEKTIETQIQKTTEKIRNLNQLELTNQKSYQSTTSEGTFLLKKETGTQTTVFSIPKENPIQKRAPRSNKQMLSSQTPSAKSLIALSTFDLLARELKPLFIPKRIFSNTVKHSIIQPISFEQPKMASMWSLGVFANYGLSTANRTELQTNQKELVDWINDKESALDFSSVGFNVHRQLHRNLSIFSGAQISVHRATFKYNDELEIIRELENVVYETEHYLDGSVIDKTRTQDVLHDANIDASLGQNYQQFSVPLGIALHTDKTKSYYFQTDLGYHFSLYQTNNGRKVVLENGDYQIINTGDFETANFQSVKASLLFGKKLNDSYNLQIGIAQAYDLSSRFNESLGRSLKFRGTGIQLGIVKGF